MKKIIIAALIIITSFLCLSYTPTHNTINNNKCISVCDIDDLPDLPPIVIF